jgi:hypothetical protein
VGQAVTIVVETNNGYDAVGAYVGGDRFGAVQVAQGQYSAVSNALQSGPASGIQHSSSECSTGLHGNGWYRIRCTFAVNEEDAGIEEGGDFQVNHILNALSDAAHWFQYTRNY